MRPSTLLRSPGVQPSPGGPRTHVDPRLAHAPETLAERARRLGPLPYSALGATPAAQALPAVGALARWEAETADRLWEEAGRPDPFTVVQIPAGDGSVAAEMLSERHRPGCSAALRLVLVEADDLLRAGHAGRLPVESPALFLGPVTVPEDPDEEPAPVAGIGPIITSLAELPVVHGPCAVIAAGWLSQFEYDLFERRDGRWHEIRLAASEDTGASLNAILVPLDPARSSHLDELVGPGARADGERYALRPAAGAWLRSALGCADTGWVVAADVWTEKTGPVPDSSPVPVALDQLSSVRPPQGDPDTPRPGREDRAADAGPGGLGVVSWRIG